MKIFCCAFCLLCFLLSSAIGELDFDVCATDLEGGYLSLTVTLDCTQSDNFFVTWDDVSEDNEGARDMTFYYLCSSQTGSEISGTIAEGINDDYDDIERNGEFSDVPIPTNVHTCRIVLCAIDGNYFSYRFDSNNCTFSVDKVTSLVQPTSSSISSASGLSSVVSTLPSFSPLDEPLPSTSHVVMSSQSYIYRQSPVLSSSSTLIAIDTSTPLPFFSIQTLLVVVLIIAVISMAVVCIFIIAVILMTRRNGKKPSLPYITVQDYRKDSLTNNCVCMYSSHPHSPPTLPDLPQTKNSSGDDSVFGDVMKVAPSAVTVIKEPSRPDSGFGEADASTWKADLRDN